MRPRCVDLLSLAVALAIGVAGCNLVDNPDPVPPPPPSMPCPSILSVTVAPDNIDLPVGDSVRMTVSARAGCAPSADTVTSWAWEGSDPTIATVSATGLVIGLRAGTVAIRARGTTPSGQAWTGYAVLRIVSPSLAVEPALATLVIGASLQFRAVRPGGGGSVPVRWSVSPPSAATVSADGVVTACYPATSFGVDARAAADSTAVARGRVSVVDAGTAIAIRTVTVAATGAAARVDALAEAVDIAIGVPAGGYACRRVVRVTLSLDDIRGGAMLIADDRTARPAQDFVATVRFDPRLAPPGEYRLIPAATLDDGRQVAGNGLLVRLVP